jgi:hypothetical protein
VPLTFFAHQAVVLPVKMRRPDLVDGTAICIGSMAPDFAYPFGGALDSHSHDPLGLLLWAIPVTLVLTVLVRRWLAPVGFAHVPDAGRFRLHSFRVLRDGEWRGAVTVMSAAAGAASHIVVDGFTHNGRFGARWLGLDTRLVRLPHWFTHGLPGWIPQLADRQISVARVLQYLGHTGGSMVGILLLFLIGRRRLVDVWYGNEQVAGARSFRLTTSQRVVFWAIVATGPVLGSVWAQRRGVSTVFSMIDATGLMTFAATLLPRCQPSTGCQP